MSNGNLSWTPKKVCGPSANVNLSCCWLCKSVGDVSFSKNIFAKGNRALLAAAEDIYSGHLRQDQLLPHLLGRPCERCLKNFLNFKTTIKESQSSFERVRDVSRYRRACIGRWPKVRRSRDREAAADSVLEYRGLESCSPQQGRRSGSFLFFL